MALLLNEAEVRELVAPAELIDAMERALAAFSSGQVNQPVRTAIQVGPQRAFFGIMPAHLFAPAALGAKLVTVFEGNASRGMTTHLATILLLDPETGALQAVMDGRYITAVRTAAVSAVAVRHLARQDAVLLAILGSGVQARSHAEILPRVRRFREIRAWSPTAKHLERFESEAASLGTRVRATASAEEAVRGADVIVLATGSSTPVIGDGWAGTGSLVISVGACRPDMREIAPALAGQARLIVDSRAAALVEAGDVVQGINEGRFTETHIAGE